MASEFGLLALNPTKKLAQQQPNPGSTSGPWMWNTQRSRVAMDDDDSWEVRAFAEDTGSVMGTTWPPRSYTCTFCRREFRSAQALGGHMNVHRRDRARLRQSPPVPADPSSSSSTSTSAVFSSSLIFPSQEFAAAAATSGGLCLVYPFPNPGNSAGVFVPTKTGYTDSPSTFLSISPFPERNGVDASLCNVGNAENAVMSDNDDDSTIEELDLELRLGQKPSQ